MKKIVSFISQSVVTILRMIFVGLAVVAFLIYKVDAFTKPQYGTNNLVLIISCFAFFPLFFALFVEFFLASIRKERRRKLKAKEKLLYQETK
jgi:hypothetical protein